MCTSSYPVKDPLIVLLLRLDTAETAERFLKLSEMCMEHAQVLTIGADDSPFQIKFNESSISTKFNHWQCRYLYKKLKTAIESVRGVTSIWRA